MFEVVVGLAAIAVVLLMIFGGVSMEQRFDAFRKDAKRMADAAESIADALEKK